MLTKTQIYKDRRDSANRYWEHVFNKALMGDLNKQEIISAMSLLNTADKNLIKLESNL